MVVPLAILAPALTAGAMYLNGKLRLSHDVPLLYGRIAMERKMARLEAADRVSLYYLMEERALDPKFANKPSLIYEGQSWTFREVYDMSNRYANYLKTELDLKLREVVAISCMNHPKLIFMTYALWGLGCIPAALNYNLTGEALVHCVKVCGSKHIFIDDEIEANFTDKVRETLSAEPLKPIFHRLDADLHQKMSKLNAVRPPDSCRTGYGFKTGERDALLAFTSGSTGFPKAAIVSWHKLVTASSVSGAWYGLNSNDIYYSTMPLYHLTAYCLAFLSCLQEGCTYAMGHKFSASTFWDEVRSTESTVIQYIGEACRYLLAKPPQIDPKTGENLDPKNKVRVAQGNGLRPDIWNRFKERYNIETIAEFYGASDGAGIALNRSSNDFSLGAIGNQGKLLSLLTSSKAAIVKIDLDTEDPIRDPKTSFCTRVAPGENGEQLYWLDASNISESYNGYYRNPNATEKKILRDVFSKGDAWFRSGDLLKKDAEGRLYFIDRLGDTYRWRSENVSTFEVAECMGNHADVSEANVYGVSVPCHDGRAGCAAMVFHDSGMDAKSAGQPTQRTLDSLAKHVSAKLPRYAMPLFLRMCKDGIPVTGNNKHQKVQLRNEGIDPAKVPDGDVIYWYRSGTYTRFAPEDYESLKAGKVIL